MAGQFTAGLSGGQRKMLLFELIAQRTANQSELLIVLDEPFAGVTDDCKFGVSLANAALCHYKPLMSTFRCLCYLEVVPFITERLLEMSAKHNILLVTNDHVETLMNLSDNTITVSAIDRSTLKINGHQNVPREKVRFCFVLHQWCRIRKRFL